jgi:hypothetical protein
MKRLMFCLVVLSLIVCDIAYAECLSCEAQSGYGSVLACTGESKFDFITKCGKPDASEVVAVDTRGHRSRSGPVNLQSSHEEKLFYNCGDGRLTKIVTVRDGIVISISSGERGSGPIRCN